MAGTSCCREPMIHITSNLLAPVATNMALMLVLIEELQMFGGVISLMRVSRCTAHWGDTVTRCQCGKGAPHWHPYYGHPKEPIISPLIKIGGFQSFQRSQNAQPWYPMFLPYIAFRPIWSSERSACLHCASSSNGSHVKDMLLWVN